MAKQEDEEDSANDVKLEINGGSDAEKNRAMKPRSARPQSESSSEMGIDRWLHHMSQVEPWFFFATTFHVAVFLDG